MIKTHHTRSGCDGSDCWRDVLLVLLAALLAALGGLVATPAASAVPALHPETRVAVIENAGGQLVGPHGTVLPGGSRKRAPNYDQDATGSSVAAEDGTTLFRTGSQTDNALTDPNAVSFRSSVSSAADQGQVFSSGDKIRSIETSSLPDGSSVVYDDVPDGPRLSIGHARRDSSCHHRGWSRQPSEELGLKPLTDPGAYRLPR